MNPAPSYARTALRRFLGGFSLAVGFLSLVAVAFAAEAPRKAFDLPAADAAQSLKAFTEQSGEQIVYPVERVRGIQTKAVKGSFTAREALDLMLAGTSLTAVQDPGSGAMAVRRQGDPAPTSSGETDAQGRVVRLGAYEVLGTRIRQTEALGPSPVSNYDREYITATGAMTLADFLNRLPQNYAGISSGRGSAPNELNPEFGSRTETSSPPFNFVLGSSALPAASTGQSGVSLRGLGSGSTLVLIDGRRVAQSSIGNAGTDSRQGYVDLNTIPLGMVERVELITDGASALYGADAVAGVVNIILKKNWSGSDLTGTYKGAFAGGGTERSLSLATGFNLGRLRGTLALDYYSRADLKGDQRTFSSQQDHSGIVEGIDPATGATVFGINYLLNWGYPATVQARTGNLTGITANGQPTRVALTPGGLSTSPTTTAGFIGVAPIGTATLANASGARRGNTSEFLDLIPPTERNGVSLTLNYALPRNLELYSTLLYSRSRGSFSGQPAIFSASATTGFGNFASIVPAAYNPFGQDVLVGMIAYEFGSVVQKTETKAYNASVGVRGRLGETWQWDLSVGAQQQDFTRLTREFNGAGVTAALANPDASQRIDPFVDARFAGAPNQRALFEKLARYITLDGDSELQSADLIADGSVYNLPGGPIRVAAGASYEYAENSTVTNTPNVAVAPVVTTATTGGDRRSWAVFSEASVPVFGKANAIPLATRLDLQLAGRYEDRGSSGSKFVPRYGLSWAPVKPLLLRASYSEGFRAPALTEYQVSAGTFTNNSVRDPRRGNTVTTGVTVTRAANASLKPETSTNEFYGLLFEPQQLKGLNLQVNYYRTEQANAIQVITEQTMVNNEASFADRITRAAPDATDTANGWPGRITTVSRSLVNFGKIVNQSVDYVVEYRLPPSALGNLRFSVTGSQTLESLREVSPGVPAIDDLGDTYSPPEWRISGMMFWNKGPWNASAFVTHLSAFNTNRAGNTFSPLGIPAQRVIDVRWGYEFQNGIWRDYGKGMRLGFGIGNLLDEQPPFADTLFGYNGALHSPLGRTYEVSFSLPL
jgi:iron complex outermembrane recepter protein